MINVVVMNQFTHNVPGYSSALKHKRTSGQWEKVLPNLILNYYSFIMSKLRYFKLLAQSPPHARRVFIGRTQIGRCFRYSIYYHIRLFSAPTFVFIVKYNTCLLICIIKVSLPADFT